MPRPHAKVIMADTIEELEAMQRPGPEPANDPPVTEPANEPEEPDEEEDNDPDEENGDEHEHPHEHEHPLPADPPHGGEGLAAVSRYQSRIHIVDAWRYPGSLAKCPDFVDPSWTSWADTDEVTKQPAGPALRVPTSGPQAEKLCRVGDYVVKQRVVLRHDAPADAQIDVWTGAEFNRLFIPVKAPTPGGYES